MGLIAVSTFYLSPALDRPQQPDFYNGVVEIETDLPPRELKFSVLRTIEAQLGRRRSRDKYAAREIDLDLVWYEGLAVNDPDLVLPDPEIAERDFLAVPLAELAPELVLPGSDQPLRDLVTRPPQSALHPLTAFTLRLRKELLHEPGQSRGTDS